MLSEAGSGFNGGRYCGTVVYGLSIDWSVPEDAHFIYDGTIVIFWLGFVLFLIVDALLLFVLWVTYKTAGGDADPEGASTAES